MSGITASSRWCGFPCAGTVRSSPSSCPGPVAIPHTTASSSGKRARSARCHRALPRWRERRSGRSRPTSRRSRRFPSRAVPSTTSFPRTAGGRCRSSNTRACGCWRSTEGSRGCCRGTQDELTPHLAIHAQALERPARAWTWPSGLRDRPDFADTCGGAGEPWASILRSRAAPACRTAPVYPERGRSMSAETHSKAPIVFVHGLWLHGDSWSSWVQFFRDNGYEATAASWPGDSQTTEETRKNAGAVAGYGVTEIADHIAKQLKAFEKKPILIGHSFGGLVVQNLLGRDLAAAAIAIDPAPIKGVSELPLSTLKSSFPALGNPFNFKRAVSLTEPQFRFGFTNAVSEQEARELYAKYAMPAPGRPLFQAATATLNPYSATKVNVANANRGPLLLVSGEKDNTVPPVMVKSTLKAYRQSPAVTELKEFPGRGHSLTIDSGWRELAQYSLAWLNAKGL